MKKYLYKYMYDNSKTIIAIFVLIAIGVIAGIVSFSLFRDSMQTELVSNMKNILDGAKSENFDGINIIKNGIRSNLIYIILIYVLAFTFFTKPSVYLVNLLRGIVIGVITAIICNIFTGFNVVIVLFTYIFLPNLLYIPSCIYTAVNSIYLNSLVFDEDTNKLYMLVTEMVKILCSFSIMFLGVFVEQLASIVICNIY